MSGTEDWSSGAMLNAAEHIAVQVAIWNHGARPGCAPALGERNAEAIRSGHGAITTIDELLRKLHALRDQLVGELRQDEDIRAVRVDAMLAEAKAERERRQS